MRSFVLVAFVASCVAQGPPPPPFGDDDLLPPPPFGDDDGHLPPSGDDDGHLPPSGDDDGHLPPSGDDDISGDTTSDFCSTSDGTTCALDGSTNEHDFSQLFYSSSTGKFDGFIGTNLCSSEPYGAGTSSPMYHSSSCRNQTIPAPDYAGAEADAVPLRGRIGLSIAGVNIYGSFDAGFQSGQVCDDGYCEGGTDVPICEESMAYLCDQAGSTINYEMLLDSCNGHAIPYHYHADMSCLYDNEDASTHSPLIGIALDGYGIYGLYEGDDALPTLDSCGGHTAEVPEDATFGVDASTVYHYHTMDYAPYVPGCYGPVDSIDECKALYPGTCYEDPVTVETSDGDVSYVLDCPCFEPPTEVGARDHFPLNNPHYNAVVRLIDADNARKHMDPKTRRARV